MPIFGARRRTVTLERVRRIGIATQMSLAGLLLGCSAPQFSLSQDQSCQEPSGRSCQARDSSDAVGTTESKDGLDPSYLGELDERGRARALPGYRQILIDSSGGSAITGNDIEANAENDIFSYDSPPETDAEFSQPEMIVGAYLGKLAIEQTCGSLTSYTKAVPKSGSLRDMLARSEETRSEGGLEVAVCIKLTHRPSGNVYFTTTPPLTLVASDKSASEGSQPASDDTIDVTPDEVSADEGSADEGNAKVDDGRFKGSTAGFDLNFDKTGYASHGGIGDDNAYDVATQSDGKIIVVGTSYNGSNTDLTVWRFNQDGSLDPTFAINGIFTHAGAGGGQGNEAAFGVAVQDDNRIVIAGESIRSNNMWSSLTVWRLTSTGALDATFNGVGYAALTVETSSSGKGLALQKDGKIVVTGYTNSTLNKTSDLLLARFHSDGSIDTTFNARGYATHHNAAGGNSHDLGAAVALQSDGKIIVAGSSVGVKDDAALWRFSAAGSLDSTFGNAGVVVHSSVGDDYLVDASIAADDRIVATGHTPGPQHVDVLVLRLTAAGQRDLTFNGTGAATYDVVANDMGKGVIVLPDQKILVTGYAGNGTNNDMFVARLNADASLDKTFTPTGIFRHDRNAATGGTGFDNFASALTLQSDGRLITVGTSHNGTNRDMAIWRINVPNLP